MIFTRIVVLAVVLGATASHAQTAPPASEVPPATTPRPPPPAKSRAHAVPHALTMPFEHVEGRLAYLRAELAITDAQAPQWDAFAGVAREAADAVRTRTETLAASGLPAAAPDRAHAMVELLAARLDAARKIVDAGATLYAALSSEQKRTADQLLAGPLGRL